MDKDYDEESNQCELLGIFKLFRIKNKEDDIIRKLRKLKFNVNLQYDRDGETLLHRAVRSNMVQVVKYLVDGGADTGMHNTAGDSPLDLAKKSPDIRELLLDLRKQDTPSQDSTTQRTPSQSSTPCVPETAERFYEKGTSGIHGNLYEVMMSAIILSRCVQRNFKFNLATNISNIGKFDDIFVQIYSEDRKRITENIFIQLKHNISNKSDSKTQTRITLNDLTTKKDEGYSIVKYYFSYRDLQSKMLIVDATKLVIFTNLKLHHEVRSLFSMNDEFTHLDFKNVTQQGKILSIKKSTLEKTSLMRNILEYEYTWVCRALMKSFKSSEPIDLGQSHLPLTRYFPYLSQQVLRVQEVGGQFCVHGLQSNFIQGKFDGLDSNDMECLHRELSKMLKERFSTHKQETRNEASPNDLTKMSIQDLDTYLNKRRIPILHWDQIMCNIWPHITEQEMGEFFNKFIFAVDQPDVEQLQQVLCDEMGEQYHLALEFKEKVLKWYMMATHNLTEINGRIMLDALIVKIQSERYSDVLDTYKIKYKEEAIGNIIKSIRKMERNVIWIGCNEPILTTIKVCQAVHNNILIHSGKYIVENGIIILDTLDNNCFHTLLINCDDDDFNSVNDIFSNSNLTNTKIILIKKAHSADECIITDEFNFSDMTEDTQDYYLKKSINFQGNIVTLGDMFPGTVDDVVVGRLMRGEDIVIGNPLKLSPRHESYIPRRVNFPIHIRDGIFLDTFSKDVFAISGVEELNKNNIKNRWVSYKSFDPKLKYDIIILDKESSRDQYDSLCEKINTEYSVHFIYYKSVNSSAILKWVQTHGDISIIKQYIKYNRMSSVEDVVKEQDCRLVAVSDTVGTGKTRLMQEIAHETKRQHPHMWVIQINLNQQTKVLKREQDKMCGGKYNYDSATNLLHKFSTPSGETPGWRLWTLTLLRRYIDSKNICILIDSFDEISPDYTELVLSFLENLINIHIPKLYLATRPNLQEALEDRIHVLSFRLVPISSDEKVTFLRNYLISLDKEQFVEEQCMEFSLWISSSENINELADSVMYLQLIAEYWNDNVKQHSAPELEQYLLIVDLYEHFFDKTFQYYESKINCDGKALQGMIKTLSYTMSILFQEIALHQLLPNYYNEYFPSSNIKDAFTKLYVFNSECIGLLNITASGEPNFIHKSFCEFLVSKYIYNQVNIKQNLHMEILINTTILTDSEFSLVRQFINNYLEKDSTILYMIANNMKDYLVRNTKLINKMTGNMPFIILKALQVACKEGCIGLIKLFFSSIKKHVHCTVFKSLDSEGNPLLHIAAKHGQVNVIKWLIEEVSFPLDCLNRDGSTIDKALIVYLERQLMYVQSRNGIERLYDFFKYLKSKTNLSNEMNYLVLWCAAFFMDLPVVKSILTEDMVYTRGPLGYTALESALMHSVQYNTNNHNTKKMIGVFLELGHNIDFKNNDYTILHTVLDFFENTNKELLEVLKLLMEKGADLSSTDNRGKTPLHIALYRKHYDSISLLISPTSVNIQDKYGSPPLHHAIIDRTPLDIIRLLLDAGADILLKNNLAMSALHVAIYNKQYDLIPWLINPTNVNMQDNCGDTPLYTAIMNKVSVDILRLLLDAGANIHLQNNSGTSALHASIYREKYDFIPLLISPTVVNIQDMFGYTPLHAAIMIKAPVDIIRLFLDAGADMHLQNTRGTSALYLAQIHYPQILSTLTSHDYLNAE